MIRDPTPDRFCSSSMCNMLTLCLYDIFHRSHLILFRRYNTQHNVNIVNTRANSEVFSYNFNSTWCAQANIKQGQPPDNINKESEIADPPKVICNLYTKRRFDDGSQNLYLQL